MGNEQLNAYGSAEVAQLLGMNIKNLQVWLQRHPEYRPNRRINKDDLIWTTQEVDLVREARERTRKHGNRKAK